MIAVVRPLQGQKPSYQFDFRNQYLTSSLIVPVQFRGSAEENRPQDQQTFANFLPHSRQSENCLDYSEAAMRKRINRLVAAVAVPELAGVLVIRSIAELFGLEVER